MKLSSSMVCIGTMLLLAVPVAGAGATDRLTDKEVKTLIEQVYNARDKFEGRLDDKVKNAVIRNSSGEINVHALLEDFQRDVEKLKDRYTDNYAASAEVQAVLVRANGIDMLMKSQAADIKGANDWDQLAKELRALADAYRTAFPLPEGAPVRRISDHEAAASAAAIVSQAEQIKQSASSDKTLAKPDKDALKSEVDAVIKQARALQSRLKESKPAAADARALIEKIGALTRDGRQLPPPVLTAVGGLRAPLVTINQAFGLGTVGTQ
jgi:hypothetical protein